MARPAPPAMTAPRTCDLPHRVLTRRDRAHSWQVYVTAPNRAAAVNRLRDLLPHLGADCVKVAPITPRPGIGTRMTADARCVLLHVIAEGGICPASAAVLFGGMRDSAARKRASLAVAALRDAGLIVDTAMQPGRHVATNEGRAIAAALATPPHDAASDDERA